MPVPCLPPSQSTELCRRPAHRLAGSGRLPFVAGGLLGLLGACGGPGPADDQLGQRRPALTTRLDPAKTVTIDVHGWNLTGPAKTGTVGEDKDAGGTGQGIRLFSGLPDGTVSPAAPNQVVATEYYGSKFPAYYSAADIAQVSALKGIPRYAAIVGKYARRVLGRSGADGLNLICHSMGCDISRYIIENDVEKLATDGKIKRWVTFAGVVGGAKLADLDHGKWLDDLAKLLGFDLIDVEHLSRDWVQQNVAVFDHDRVSGNNPKFAGILIHHILATNPKIDRAASIPLMDVLGYSNVPNDGIVLDEEMFLHDQAPAARFTTPSGDKLPVSQSHHFANHFNITDQISAQAIAAANLVGSRRVKVTLRSVTLVNDHTDPFFDKPPAAVVIESFIKYPYLKALAPTDPVLDEVSMERRNAPVLTMNKGDTQTPNYVVFEGPVFDAQTSVAVSVNLAQTRWYPAGGVSKNILMPPVPLGAFSGEVPLADGDYTVTSGDTRFTLHVAIEPLY